MESSDFTSVKMTGVIVAINYLKMPGTILILLRLFWEKREESLELTSYRLSQNRLDYVVDDLEGSPV